MKNAKRKFALLLAMLALTLQASAEDVTHLVLKLKSGDVYGFLLKDKPVFSFGSDHLTLTVPFSQFRYEDIEDFSFDIQSYEEGVVVGLDEKEAPAAKQVFKYVDGQTVYINGISDRPRVTVNAVDGKSVKVDAVTNGQSVTLNLSHLPKGYYVITVDKQSYKIYKK